MCNKIQCLLSKAKHCILWFLSKGTSLYHRIFSLSTCFFTLLWAYNDRNSALFQRSAIADYDIVVGGTTLHRLSISNINGDMVNTLIPPIPWCSGSTEANQVSWSEFFGIVCFGGLNSFSLSYIITGNIRRNRRPICFSDKIFSCRPIASIDKRGTIIIIFAHTSCLAVFFLAHLLIAISHGLYRRFRADSQIVFQYFSIDYTGDYGTSILPCRHLPGLIHNSHCRITGGIHRDTGRIEPGCFQRQTLVFLIKTIRCFQFRICHCNFTSKLYAVHRTGNHSCARFFRLYGHTRCGKRN